MIDTLVSKKLELLQEYVAITKLIIKNITNISTNNTALSRSEDISPSQAIDGNINVSKVNKYSEFAPLNELLEQRQAILDKTKEADSNINEYISSLDEERAHLLRNLVSLKNSSKHEDFPRLYLLTDALRKTFVECVNLDKKANQLAKEKKDSALNMIKGKKNSNLIKNYQIYNPNNKGFLFDKTK